MILYVGIPELFAGPGDGTQVAWVMLRVGDQQTEIIFPCRALVVLPFGALQIVRKMREVSRRPESFEVVGKAEIGLKMAGDDLEHGAPILLSRLEFGVKRRAEYFAQMITKGKELERKFRLSPHRERLGILDKFHECEQQFVLCARQEERFTCASFLAAYSRSIGRR